jgi:hypothetical protein
VPFLRVKRDLPNASNKSVEIAILLKIVQRSFNKKSSVNTTPRGRHCKLCPGGIYGSYRWNAFINFREGSSDWKLKVLVYFLRVNRDQGVTRPSPSMSFFPRCIQKEI